MADLASLGLAVDSSQIDAANAALGTFAASGKSAQQSADVLTAAAVRLGISVDEVQRRLDAANDNMASNAEQAIKLADATKMASAANDNLSDSISNAGAAVNDTGRGFLATTETILNLTSHLKLLALGAYALFPAFRGIVNAGLKEALSAIIPVGSIVSSVLGSIVSVLSPMLDFFTRIGTPIAIVVAAFEFLHSVWNTGVALLDKYADSLRALYSDDIASNLEKLTKNQQDIISAEQVQTATDLGSRLKDAQFTIDQILKTSFDLTDPALRFQAVWVSIKEGTAATLLSIIGLPNAIDKAAKAFGNSPIWDAISGRTPGQIVDLSTSEENSAQTDPNASLDAATSKLSAIMGVAALASEALNKTKGSIDDVANALNIGDTFIVRFSDDTKKLAEGAPTDNWDRVSKSIDRQTASLEANAASAGKSVQFQESLRVEMQLLNSTSGGLNAVTDTQTDAYVELRTKGIDPLNAAIQAGIVFDAARAKSFASMSKNAGDAKLEFAQANATIANTKALKSDTISEQALTAYSATQKGVIADLQKRNELQKDLDDKVLTQEQVDARAASAAKLASDTELKALSEAARARALAATQTAATTQASIDAAGLSVGAAYKLTTVEQARQQLEQIASQQHKQDAAGNLIIDQAELDRLTLKINKTGDLKQAEAQAAAQRTADFDRQTVFLSAVDQQIASVQKGLHGDGWQAFMNDGLAASMRITAALKDTKDMGTSFTQSFVSGLLQGKSAMDSLVAAADQLAASLANAGIKNLLSGDPTQMAIGAAQEAGAALLSMFTGDQKAKQALQAAQAAWAAMTEQVTNFNLAAKGVNLGPLTSAIQSLEQSYATIQAAALKAGDIAGADAASATFAKGVNNVIAEFKAGTPVLDPLQTSIKALNDEYAGLAATLADLHSSSLLSISDLQKNMAALLQTYSDTMMASLTNRLNTAQGNTDYNDAAALLTQHAQDLSDAAALGNSPTLLSQISATFQAEAQKIVESAGLVGPAFDSFLQQFPELTGVVTQSATAIAAANANFTALTKTINDYLASLQIGSNSILSPQGQLSAAQDQFNSQLALAKGGDQTALGSITQYASTLLTQAKSFYASSSGYTDTYNAVTSALSNLTGNSSALTSPGTSSLVGSPVGGVTMPQGMAVTTTPTASNDNSQLFTQQTNSLVQAIGSAASAQIAKLQEQVDRLVVQNTQLIAAVTANKPQPMRPNQKYGT